MSTWWSPSSILQSACCSRCCLVVVSSLPSYLSISFSTKLDQLGVPRYYHYSSLVTATMADTKTKTTQQPSQTQQSTTPNGGKAIEVDTDNTDTASIQSKHSYHESIPRDFSAENVFDKYKIEKVLGTGSMGEVAQVRVKRNKVGGSAFVSRKKVLGLFQYQQRTGHLKEESLSDHTYALKSIILDRVSPQFFKELQNEITILRSCDHPNIVKLYEVYSYHSAIYCVLELCEGGDLFTRTPYSELEAARILDQLLSAVCYMHDHGIVHRDLKFENILFESTAANAQIKVIDFGLSKKFLGAPKYMTQRVGTIYTMAPQVLQGIYSSQADLWSIGVITYMLLSNTKPFYDVSRRKMIDKIMRCDYSLEGPEWEKITECAKDFVSKLLILDPKERMKRSQAVKHPFITMREQLPDEKPSPELLARIDDCLVNYKQTSELKKLALNIIAHRSNMKEISELRKAFEFFDKKNNGIITFVEFKQALQNSKYSPETLEEIFFSIDSNHDGKLNYTEFLAATIEAHGYITEDRIAEAFDRLDCDDNGYITKQNLKDLLQKDQVEGILDNFDSDGDGKITYKEFLDAFRNTTHKNVKTISRMDSTVSEGENSTTGSDHRIAAAQRYKKNNFRRKQTFAPQQFLWHKYYY